MMRATNFEFEQRFFFIGGIFGAGFACYAIDQQNLGVAIAQFLYKGLDINSPAGLHVLRIIFGIGAALAVAAAALRTWGAAYLQSEVVHDQALHSEALVADGPYRYTRNPLYLGGVMLAAGMGLMASRLGWFVMTLGLLFFYYRLIWREETGLMESQGERFRTFCGAVPRFWPALRPRVASGGMKPRWAQAWLGETFIWGFAGGTVVFTATLSVGYFWIATGAGFAAYFVAQYIFKRRKGQQTASSR